MENDLSFPIAPKDAFTDITEFCRQFAGMDVNEVYKRFAPLAAAMQGAIATGLVPQATVRERLRAAEAILDRAQGTVVPVDVNAQLLEKREEFRNRIAALEAKARSEGRWASGNVHPLHPSSRTG